MPWALAKFWPKKCEVPACKAFLSCIMASMLWVSRAPGESLVGGFGAFDDGHGHDVFGEACVDLVHLLGFFEGLGFGGVCGVAFLPEKFGGAKEQAGA